MLPAAMEELAISSPHSADNFSTRTAPPTFFTSSLLSPKQHVLNAESFTTPASDSRPLAAKNVTGTSIPPGGGHCSLGLTTLTSLTRLEVGPMLPLLSSGEAHDDSNIDEGTIM